MKLLIYDANNMQSKSVFPDAGHTVANKKCRPLWLMLFTMTNKITKLNVVNVKL